MEMQDPVPKGTIVERDDGLIFKILEDTTAHTVARKLKFGR